MLGKAIASAFSVSAMVILNGRAHALTCIRDQTPDAGWIMLVPGLEHLHASETDTWLVSCHHDWGALEPLSRCQLDTLRNVTLGLTNDEIARKICRTKRAVEWHIRFLNQHLGATGRERLCVIGREAGLHRFSDGAWEQLLRTRPARRSSDDVVVANRAGGGIRTIQLVA